MPPALDIDLLLRHADWVRRLLRELTADAHEAEDLLQETWLRALRTPPQQAGTLRAWLARVAGRLAANARQAARRRTQREARAARPCEALREGAWLRHSPPAGGAAAPRRTP